jgi:hypothetical protein
MLIQDGHSRREMEKNVTRAALREVSNLVAEESRTSDTAIMI